MKYFLFSLNQNKSPIEEILSVCLISLNVMISVGSMAKLLNFRLDQCM